MSKRLFKNTVLSSLIVFSGLSAVAAPKNIVAVVDVRAVVEGTKHFTEMQAKMQETLGAKHEELVLAQKNLGEERATLEKSKKVTAEATCKAKLADLDKKQSDLAGRERTFQEEVMKMQEESMQKLYAVVKASTKKVAQEQGFEIVLQGEALYVSNDKYDLTTKVKKAVENSKL